jgi:high-affinity iron transporter
MVEISGFIVTFRETLEVILILGAIVAYLAATKQQKNLKQVYSGALAGMALSVVFAFGFIALIGEFEGVAEQLFEGTLLLVGALIVTLLVIWLTKTAHGVKGIKENVLDKLNGMEAGSVFLISLIVVLREGVEAVLFLGALSIEDSALALGSLIGIIIGIVIGYLIYKNLIKIDLMKMMAGISIILVFFGAGMFGQGLHELQEAKILPFMEDKLYDIGGTQNADGSYSLLHEDGLIGGILKGVFGYDSDPTQLQGLGYILYLVGMGAILVPLKKRSTI